MSNSVIGALRVTLGLDSAKFETGAKRVKAQSQNLGAALSKISAAAGIAAAGLIAMQRRTSGIIDAQAKLAQSLGTTVSSVQVLARAGELAGVSMGGIEQATKDLTRRLSQAAAGTGPAIAALDKLGLSATALLGLPLDERVAQINQAILDFVPAAERAAVAGQLFGEEGSLALSRLDPTTIATANAELERFGVKISEIDKTKVEEANDAISRLGLIGQGLANQLSVSLAPALERLADGIAEFTAKGTVFNQVMTKLAENADLVFGALSAVAGLVAVKMVASFAAATASVVSMVAAIGPLAPIIAALTGPLGVALALATAAAAAFLLFGRNTETAGGHVGEARVALNLLNEALGGFNAAAPVAAGNAISTAQAYAQQAQQALAAAEAEVALMEAEMARFNAAPVEERGLLTGDMEEGAMARNIGLARQEVDSLRESLDLARARIRQKATEVTSYAGAWQETADTLATTRVELEGVSDILDQVGGASGGGLKGVTEGAQQAAGAMSDLLDASQDVASIGKSAIDGLSSAFSAAIRGADTLQGALSKLADQLADQFLQLGFNQLFGALFPNLGGFAGFGIPGRAIGDSYTDAGLHLVGERGAELVQLPRGSKVFDHNRTRSMFDRGGEAPAAAPVVNLRNINVLDPRLLGDYIGTPEGEQALVNLIQRNRGSFN